MHNIFPQDLTAEYISQCVHVYVCVCTSVYVVHMHVFVLYALNVENMCFQRMCKRLGPVQVRGSKHPLFFYVFQEHRSSQLVYTCVFCPKNDHGDTLPASTRFVGCICGLLMSWHVVSRQVIRCLKESSPPPKHPTLTSHDRSLLAGY